METHTGTKENLAGVHTLRSRVGDGYERNELKCVGSKIGEGGCCDPSKLVQVRVEQCWSYLWKIIVDVASGPDDPGDLRLGPRDVIELQPGRPAAMEL